jgi:arylsulfatase
LQNNHLFAVIAATALSLVFAHPVLAANSASLSTQADNVLPRPTPPFKGKIGKTYKESVADFPQPLRAPNVVVILLDDVGFGHPGTFGGPIPTPNLDKLASDGLRYNTFHTTGICSPTRAAVLTGLNHHQVGFGTIAELSTGFPGYDSVWPLEATTVAGVLKENGYESPPQMVVCM